MYHIKDDKRSRDSASLLVEALSQIMAGSDFRTITVSQLVRRAGVARATFYRNFDVIDDLLRLECDRAFDEMRSHMVARYRSGKLGIPGVRTVLLEPVLEYWGRRSELLSLIVQANRADLLYEGFRQTVRTMLSLRAAENSAVWKSTNYFVALRAGETVSVLLEWIENGCDLRPHELATMIARQVSESMNLQLQVGADALEP